MIKKLKNVEDSMKMLDCHASLAMTLGRKARSLAFSMADRRSGRFYILDIQRIAFTMAEILLSLTIIGIVAAITLPALTGNINERTWNTQRKALYTRMSQAIALMGSLNGYGIGATKSETTANAAQAFVTDGLAKVLKINNICDKSHLEDCGIVSTYKKMNGKAGTFPTTLTELQNTLTGSWGYEHPKFSTAKDNFSLPGINAAAFETINGESIAVFYQPYCHNNMFKDKDIKTTKLAIFPQPFMCANFIYDLNGMKGPNQVGKDIGYITAFYPTDSEVVMPQPLPHESGNSTVTIAEALKVCSNTNQNVRTPSREELASMVINRRFSAMPSAGAYIMKDGGTISSASIFWLYNLNVSVSVRCVKQ